METGFKAQRAMALVAVVVALLATGCGRNDGINSPGVDANAANSADASLTTIPAPVVWHRFDGDTHDSSGNGHDALVYGYPQFVDGCVDQAMYFDGENDYLNIPADPELEPTRFTVELYFKPAEELTDDAGFVPIVVKMPATGNFWNTVDGYDLWYQDSGVGGRLGAGVGSNGGTLRVAPSQFLGVSPDDFHHLVETYDGVKVKLYIDGYLVDVRAKTGNPAYLGGPIWIGGNIKHTYYGSSYDRFFFHGTIDEFALYDYALSPSQVRERFTRCRAAALAGTTEPVTEPERRVGVAR